MRELDRTDRKILDILQKNARIAMTELAEKVGLSATPCTERVRRLEREGVITGYHAHVNPHALGRGRSGSERLVQAGEHARVSLPWGAWVLCCAYTPAPGRARREACLRRAFFISGPGFSWIIGLNLTRR